MIEYLKKIAKKEKFKLLLQFVKFCLVGVSNTIVSYVLYAVIIFLLRNLSWRHDYIFANVTSFTLSIFWAFYWNNKYVFKEEDTGKRKIWRALGKSFLVYGFTGYILDNVLSYVWIQRLGLSRYIAPLFNLPFSVPVNYLLNKLWAFKGKLHDSDE